MEGFLAFFALMICYYVLKSFILSFYYATKIRKAEAQRAELQEEQVKLKKLIAEHVKKPAGLGTYIEFLNKKYMYESNK